MSMPTIWISFDFRKFFFHCTDSFFGLSSIIFFYEFSKYKQTCHICWMEFAICDKLISHQSKRHTFRSTQISILAACKFSMFAVFFISIFNVFSSNQLTSLLYFNYTVFTYFFSIKRHGKRRLIMGLKICYSGEWVDVITAIDKQYLIWHIYQLFEILWPPLFECHQLWQPELIFFFIEIRTLNLALFAP